MSNLAYILSNSAVISYIVAYSILLAGCDTENDLGRVGQADTNTTQQEPSKIPSRQSDELREEVQRVEEERQDEVADPTGVYVFESREYVIKLRVMGSTWIATTTPVTGFGEDYDAEQTEVSSGSVQGTDLYEETGYIKVGKLYQIGSGWSASMLFGGGSVTLLKR